MMGNIAHNKEKWEIEEHALRVLRQCNMFQKVNLVHAEKPDIQAVDKSWGIEVVIAADTEFVEAQKVFEIKKKVPFDTPNIKFDCQAKVRENGTYTNLKPGSRIELPCDEVCLTSHPNSDTLEIQVLHRVISQKITKLQNGNYKGFDKVGLFVFTEVPIEAKKDCILPFLRIQTSPIMFDYFFFYNQPYYDILMNYHPEQVWVISRDEFFAE